MDASHASDKADLLRMSEQRFQMVWELASDAMTLSTADGIVIAANPAYFRLYGYAPEMVLGQSFSVIFPEEERSWAEKLYQIRYRSPVPQAAVETTVRRADGGERTVEASYTFLEEQGRRIAMLSIIRDITEHKQREEQLRENGLKLQMARELVHLESWEWDLTTNQIRWSPMSTRNSVRSCRREGRLAMPFWNWCMQRIVRRFNGQYGRILRGSQNGQSYSASVTPMAHTGGRSSVRTRLPTRRAGWYAR